MPTTGGEGFSQAFYGPSFNSTIASPPVYAKWLGSIVTYFGQIANIEQTGRSEVKFIVTDMLYMLNRQTPPNVLQSQCRHNVFEFQLRCAQWPLPNFDNAGCQQ